ncbi:hypothetical protein ILYODFUR_031257, partial [Ilyodon furcidens]
YNLLDSKINTVLSMCQDINLLNPVHGIVQSVVYHEESPPQFQPSYLQSFGFNGLWRFAGPFSKVLMLLIPVMSFFWSILTGLQLCKTCAATLASDVMVKKAHNVKYACR